MVTSAVLPDLRRRAGEPAVIVSRVLRTWGESESGLAELLGRASPSSTTPGNPDARLPRQRHRGHQGAHHRQGRRRATAAASCSTPRRPSCARSLGRPRVRRRRRDDGGAVAAPARGARARRSASPSRSPAGSSPPGSSTSPARATWFRGASCRYDSEVKFDVLGVPEGPVVSAEAARGDGRRVRGACSAPTSGWPPPASPGPAEQEGQPAGHGVRRRSAMGDDERRVGRAAPAGRPAADPRSSPPSPRSTCCGGLAVRRASARDG